MDLKIPEIIAQDVLSLERHVIEPLQIELESSYPNQRPAEKSDRQQQAYTDIMNYDMPYFDYNRGTLIDCWYRMFQHFDLLDKFKISQQSMQGFLLEVCRKYQRVPFHNMTHAFNVTHVCFYVIC